VTDDRPVDDRIPDETLVAMARDGDGDAFGELVARYRELAFRVAWVVAPGGEAEDAVQEAFVKAWFALPRFRQGAPFRPWLCRIVANEARNRVRSARRRDALALRDAAATPRADIAPPDDAAIARGDAEVLVAAMNRLKPDDRLIVAYRWLFELSEAEMADALDVPAGTVKSRLSRAMTRLRETIGELDPDPDPTEVVS
jgi:RNA polymerase sigma-70 factor (ECF subfamily)